jgi:hypothetical protein
MMVYTLCYPPTYALCYSGIRDYRLNLEILHLSFRFWIWDTERFPREHLLRHFYILNRRGYRKGSARFRTRNINEKTLGGTSIQYNKETPQRRDLVSLHKVLLQYYRAGSVTAFRLMGIPIRLNEL